MQCNAQERRGLRPSIYPKDCELYCTLDGLNDQRGWTTAESQPASGSKIIRDFLLSPYFFSGDCERSFRLMNWIWCSHWYGKCTNLRSTRYVWFRAQESAIYKLSAATAGSHRTDIHRTDSTDAPSDMD